MNDDLDAVRTETLLADVERKAGAPCAACAVSLSGHDVLAAVWLGFRDAPRCPRCVAERLGRDVSEFLRHVRGALLRRECYREAWETIVDREGFDPYADDAPGATWSAPAPTSSEATDADAAIDVDATYDAGDLGCGDLVMELRARLRALRPGAVLALRALDPGAKEDIPAWCGLTGHRLLSAAHPAYLIRRKED
jgi:tRNA 2-thiouridine synthesizing protein A